MDIKNVKKTKREIETENKKGKIVEEAVKLFIEYGYNKTTIADISKATGFSSGSIYNFFGNKAGILRDLTKNDYRTAANNMLLDDESIMNPKKALLKYYQDIGESLEMYGREMVKAAMEACSEEYHSGKELEYWAVSIQAVVILF